MLRVGSSNLNSLIGAPRIADSLIQAKDSMISHQGYGYHEIDELIYELFGK
jgi:hypothetical protein